jgi:hypothetical protein
MINNLKAGDLVWYRNEGWREDDIGVLVVHEKRLLGLLIEKDTSVLSHGGTVFTQAWKVLPIGSQKIEKVLIYNIKEKANVR